MPQTINVRVHATITCALTDLVTVNISGDNQNQVYIKNNGPGIIWLSFDPATIATVAGVSTFGLKVGETFTRTHVPRNQAFTLIADTASTVVTMSVSAFP